MWEDFMYRKSTYGAILTADPLHWATGVRKGLLDTFFPETARSIRWKYWSAVLDFKLCKECRAHHGKIYAMDERPGVEPPLHDHCRCAILPMETITPGGATKDGENGADYWLVHYGQLPDYYISKEEIRKLKWNEGKAPRKYAPGKMIFGGIYNNENGHLPSAHGRIWYETDINYYEGRRNGHRVLFSNDGLIFVTYDHYLTFYEITYDGKDENEV